MLQHVALDELALLFDSVVFAAGSTGAVGNHDSTAVNLGIGTGGELDLDQQNPGEIFIELDSLITIQTGATVQFILIDCDTVGGTYAAVTPIGVQSAAIAGSGLVGVISRFSMPIPRDGVRQFVKLRVTIGTDTVDSGSILAGVVKGPS